jgi:hypothetical protein
MLMPTLDDCASVGAASPGVFDVLVMVFSLKFSQRSPFLKDQRRELPSNKTNQGFYIKGRVEWRLLEIDKRARLSVSIEQLSGAVD